MLGRSTKLASETVPMLFPVNEMLLRLGNPANVRGRRVPILLFLRSTCNAKLLAQTSFRHKHYYHDFT